MPTDSQTGLHDAITAYRAYLETGERCTPPLYRDPGDGSGYVPDGDVECICVRGVHGTEQLRTLRTRLGKVVEAARAEPSLRPALDALPGGCYGFNSLMDFTVNPPAIAASFRAQATAFEPFTHCEYVRADVLRALDRALARLPGETAKSEKAPAGGGQGGEGRSSNSASEPRGWIARLSENVAAQIIATVLGFVILAIAYWKWPWIKQLLG